MPRFSIAQLTPQDARGIMVVHHLQEQERTVTMFNYTTDQSYKELASRMDELRSEIAERDKVTKALKEELDFIRQNILPSKMDEEGISTINIKGVGRITVQPQMKVSCLKDNQPLLRQWFREHGYGELVVETINSSTLKAWLKERIEEMDDYPADLLSIHAFEQASLTKK